MHVTVPLPDRISATDARKIASGIEKLVNRHTGALVEAVITDLAPLSDQERRVIVTALDVAEAAGGMFTPATIELRQRLDPSSRAALVAETLREHAGDHDDLSRPQELAADAMAGEYGRSRVRHLADGAVVISGLTGNVERAQVCIERDGRERWRS